MSTHAGSAAGPILPDKPLLVIEPSKRWVAADLPAIWAYRDLLYFLTWRDVMVRYKQTALGVVWAVLQPVLTMVIFTFIFGRAAGVPSDGLPYSVFAYAGLVPWLYFSNAVQAGGNSLVGNAGLVGKVYFPRLIMPCASALAGLVDFAAAFVMMFALILYHGIVPNWSLLALPVLVLLTVLLAIAIGSFFAALNVAYRDVRYALPFFVQLGMFATPVIYPASIVSEKWRWLLDLNPMTAIIEGYRAALLGGTLDGAALLRSAAMILALLVGGVYYFRSVEKSFADLV